MTASLAAQQSPPGNVPAADEPGANQPDENGPAAADEPRPAESPQPPASGSDDSERGNSNQSETGLPKLEDMILPTAEELLKRSDVSKGGQPLDWVVLHNDDVIVSKPVYPRPATLEKMQAAIEASTNWPRPQNDQQRTVQRRQREQLNYLVIEIEGEPEYQLHRKEIREIVYHEDMMLRRIDALIEAGQLREAFEMLYILERNSGGWPGSPQRAQNLVFHDAELKRKAGQLEAALALYSDLFERNPNYPGWSAGVGQVVDALVQAANEQQDFNRTRHYINRLKAMQGNHPVAVRWTSDMQQRAGNLLDSAASAAESGQHDVGAALALESAKVWPVPPNRRALFSRIVDRYQRIEVGVEQLSHQPRAYFLPSAADLRHEFLTTSQLFELDRNDEVPHFTTRFFEQWEPTDLGRRIDFRLMERSSYWETRPVLTSSQVVGSLAGKLDPQNPRFDERFATYVREIRMQSPFEFSIMFNRVPLRTEVLLATPVVDETPPEDVDQPVDSRPELLSQRFVEVGRDAGSVTYRRAVPEPDRAPVYHLAEMTERKFDSYRELTQAFLRHEVELIPRIRPWHAEAFEADNRFFTVQYAIPETHCLQFNPQSVPLRNRELRRALAYAIDRETILKRTMLQDEKAEHGRLISGPFSSRSYAHSPLVEQREFDLTLGLSLAIAARHELGGEIPPLKMICPPDEVVETAARQFIAAWQRIGINVELLPNDGSVVLTGPEDEGWDIVFRTHRMEEPLVDLWPYLTLQPTARIEDLAHFPDWLRIELVEVDNAGSWPQAIDRLRTLHRHLMEEVHLIPLWEVETFMVMWRSVSGTSDEPIHAYQNVERWIYKP